MSDIEGFIRTALGEFGPLLDDDQVVELSANQNGAVFVERLGAPPEHIGTLEVAARERIIRFCATASGTPVTETAPIVSAKMPGTGFRFEGIKPPAAEAPLFSIRFHAARILKMADYVEQNVVTPDQAEFLLAALRAHKNIVVAGGTGSGKTTFLNMLIGELSAPDTEQERLIIIEDTPEIKTNNPNAVFLKTTKDVDMTRLLASSLRLRPDRIIVGEVRDGAALAMIKAWNTGHPGGLTSVHANSAIAALTRIDLLIREASSMPLPEIIGLGVDVVVFIKADRHARGVEEIIEVKGYENEKYIIN
jgi:P-type conjugative transfer ATPase TrbB